MIFALTPDDMDAVLARHRASLGDPVRGRLLPAALAAAGTALFAFGLYWLDFSPQRIVTGLASLGQFAVLMVPPDPHGHAWLYLRALAETLAISLLGTLTAALLAFPFGLCAARNVVSNPVAHFVVRRCLDTVRSIDTLVWALLWIAVVGLGPFAGVLAIASADFGAFGKLFSETIEAADRRAVEGVRSAGGRRSDEVRLGLLPEVMPVLAGQVLYFFESNTRSATIIGIVGAGGIGLHLYEAIRTLEWQEVSFIVILVLITVALIDTISTRLRAAMRSTPARA